MPKCKCKCKANTRADNQALIDRAAVAIDVVRKLNPNLPPDLMESVALAMMPTETAELKLLLVNLDAQ